MSGRSRGASESGVDRSARFDRASIQLRPLAERGSDLDAGGVRPLAADRGFRHPDLPGLADAIHQARERGAAVILLLGGHPIKLGLSRYLADLIERGLVTHVATNGSGIIHDFELAAFGETSENVAKWIQAGQFGLWRETGRLNDVIRQAAERDQGLGEGVGRVIEEERFPHRELSLCAAGWRCGVPVTCHVTIGADIIHAHANCDGAVLGQTSYADFLTFAESVRRLEESMPSLRQPGPPVKAEMAVDRVSGRG